MKNVFKICSCCDRVFKTKSQFLDETKCIGKWEEVGLSLHNCICGSTLSIELFAGSKQLAKMRRDMQRLKDEEDTNGSS